VQADRGLSDPRDLSRPRATDLALVVVAALAFSTSAPLAKVAHGVAPLAIAAGRCVVAALAIAVGWPRAMAAALGALTSRQRLALPIAGLLLGGHLALFTVGLVSTSLAAAVALVSLEPIAVVVAAWIAFRLRPSRAELIGLVVASAGAMIVASGAGAGEHRLLGDLIVLAGVVFFGAYVAFARGLRDAMPVLPYAGWVYGVAAVALAPIAIAAQLALPAGAPASSLASWGAVALLGLIPTFIGHTLLQSIARHVSPAVLGLVCPGETVGSIALGALFLATTPTLREAIGTAVVLAGATLTVTGARTG
jgi:drug/metabolite transporter (DMT)-like permease